MTKLIRPEGLITRRGLIRCFAACAPAIIIPGKAAAQLAAPLLNCGGDDWNTFSSQTLNQDSPTWDGYNVRVAINSAAFTYAYRCAFRARLIAVTSGANLVLASLWAGVSTTPPDFDTTPLPLRVGGSASPTLVPGSTNFTNKLLNFFPNKTKYLMFSFGITSGDIRRNIAASSNYTFWFSPGQSAAAGNAVMAGGRGSTGSRCDIVDLVQVAS